MPLHALPALRSSFSLRFSSISELSFLPGFIANCDPLSLSRHDCIASYGSVQDPSRSGTGNSHRTAETPLEKPDSGFCFWLSRHLDFAAFACPASLHALFLTLPLHALLHACLYLLYFICLHCLPLLYFSHYMSK